MSDGALSQAVRTLRRALGDDSREPLFIRTVSRHGYRFVFADVIEEADDGTPRAPRRPRLRRRRPPRRSLRGRRSRRCWGERRRRRGGGDGAPRGRRALHALGTAEALRRLDRVPGHARARALLRDARWDVPGAGPVPLLGAARRAAAAARTRPHAAAARAPARRAARWAGASAGGAAAGLVGRRSRAASPGARAGTARLADAAPSCRWRRRRLVGGVGAAGVGAGLAMAEALARSARAAPPSWPAGRARRRCRRSRGSIGSAAWTLAASSASDLRTVGRRARRAGPRRGGGPGLRAGDAAAEPAGWPFRRAGGSGCARPSPPRRCALAAVALTVGRPARPPGPAYNAMARAFQGSQVTLEPWPAGGRAGGMGPSTRAVMAARGPSRGRPDPGPDTPRPLSFRSTFSSRASQHGFPRRRARLGP